MDDSREARRAKREERGKLRDAGDGKPREKRDPATMARVKAIRARLEELAAERIKLREELVALREPGAADDDATTA
jgi:hypothetical protein